jgi:hypothetical protein
VREIDDAVIDDVEVRGRLVDIPTSTHRPVQCRLHAVPRHAQDRTAQCVTDPAIEGGPADRVFDVRQIDLDVGHPHAVNVAIARGDTGGGW